VCAAPSCFAARPADAVVKRPLQAALPLRGEAIQEVEPGASERLRRVNRMFTLSGAPWPLRRAPEAPSVFSSSEQSFDAARKLRQRAATASPTVACDQLRSSHAP
jgi:hypothetical protein